MPSTKDKWVRRFVIPETTRHRKGFTIYKVTSVIYLKASREEVSKVSVWKRYNDFKKLHSALYALHAHFQIKDPFPPFTKSKFFGRFEVEVVQERKNSALKLLDFIGKHRCLYTSDIFIKFFEKSSLQNDSDTINGRSQSVGSDTSEDDHNIAGLNDAAAALTNSIEIIESAPLSLGNIIDLTEEESRSFDVEESPFEIAGPLKEAVAEEEVEKCCCVTAKGGNNGFVVSASDDLKLDDRYNSKHENNKRYELKKTKMLKINKAIQDCTDLAHTCKDVTHYIVVAAAYISAAFKHEAIAEYEEAFAQYKMGISTLLLGVETDTDDARKIIIKEKVSKYLDRAEKLYNRYLNWNISLLNKPTADLKNYKVLNIIDSLMLVKDLHTNNVRIVKSIEKPLSNKENPISDYILRGQIPFMVRLHGYIETEATVFLILEYVKRGRLWDFIIKNYKSQDDALKSDDDYHSAERIRLGIGDECQNTFEGICNDENERKLITERFRYDVEESTRMNLVTSTNEENAQCQLVYNVDDICGSDVPTTQLLEKAQKLLKSVNATLRRSNFVVNRSNESKEEFICSRKNVSRALNMSNEVASQFKESPSSVDNNLKRFLIDSLDNSSFANAQDNNTSSSNSSTSNSMMIITDDVKQEECYSTYENNVGSLGINDGGIGERTKCFSKNNSLDGGALWEIPEEVVCRWAAEILLALEALHQQGVIIFDLKPEKILLDEHGRATLTYIVPYRNGELTKIREQEYSSPELYMFSPTTCTSPATDIWNYGIILYELLTGIKFRSLHGEAFRSHSVVSVPTKLSDNARSLLLNILKYEPEERLTISDIKKHYFFEKIDWSSMVYSTI
ncbi:ribosomal protein S6 kinase delta-1 [Vespa crabro]|uniref:ribosomal protein S6 kinase delta-1 n=1 Tax=Vespa crabro TaxID=7445 RepID=UPI001F012023|nr:ribosomal protein S6 kinase delta-1 [Vespa crabro]